MENKEEKIEIINSEDNSERINLPEIESLEKKSNENAEEINSDMINKDNDDENRQKEDDELINFSDIKNKTKKFIKNLTDKSNSNKNKINQDNDNEKDKHQSDKEISFNLKKFSLLK